MRIGRILFALASTAIGVGAKAAVTAADVSTNYTIYSNPNGVNGGTGFAAWITSQVGSSGGIYVNTVASGGFDAFDNGAQGGGTTVDQVTAIRPFTGALTTNQAFSFTEALNSNSNAINGGPGHLGFSLENNSGVVLFDLHTEGGNYLYTDASNTKTDSQIGYNYQSVRTFTFTLVNASTGAYMLTAGATTLTGNIAVGGSISQFAIYNNNGGYGSDVVFDNLAINNVPEPTTFMLMGMLGLPAILRRRG